MPCDLCRDMLAGKRRPLCEKCLPNILPENEEAYEVWSIAQGQLVTVGMGEVIDISIPAVEIVMNHLQVRDPERCLIKVQKLVREINDAQKNKQEHGKQ